MAFPIPLRTFVVEGSGCSNLFASMPRLLSDEAYGGHMKLILATENTPRRTVRDALSVIKTGTDRIHEE
jgi:hypothetical protein